MKKPSFFERLAGNLRFDDTDEIASEVKERKSSALERATRELEIKSEEDTTPAPKQEEVGELPVDVYETPNEIIIQTLIAGVTPEHLSIDITRDVVSIRGKREEAKGVPNDAYHVRDRKSVV